MRWRCGAENNNNNNNNNNKQQQQPPSSPSSLKKRSSLLKEATSEDEELELLTETSPLTESSPSETLVRSRGSLALEAATSRQSLRTQLTGGIQATTATLDLPEPQVAVRNLLEYAKHAHMSTVMSKAQHRRANYPFGSIVEFAVDGSGYPVFAMSSLAIHTRNVLANPRCAIQVHAPGWTGLNNARVTLFGDVFPVDPNSVRDAASLFDTKRERMGTGFHQSKGANLSYFVMSRIVDILFVGGYGTVKWIKPEDYVSAEPDFILQDLSNTIKTCNDKYSEAIREMLPEADDVVFISVDKRGVELRVREGTEDSVRRLTFKKNCFTIQDVCTQINDLIKE